MRIVIFGVGAMGCLFGARLTGLSANSDTLDSVLMVGRWPAQLDALRAAPLRLIPPEGAPEHIPVTAVNDPTPHAPFDVALILTKAARTEDVARMAAQVLAEDGIAITLQNGVGNDDTLARFIDADRVTLGVTTQGAATDGPGVVRPSGGGFTHLATAPPIKEQVRAVAALFEAVGFVTEVASDVSGLVWNKLAVNAAINPVTAILRVPNGALLDSPHTRALMASAAREVAAVAEALGIQPPAGHWSAADPARTAEEVARLTATNRSSMLQDVLRGADTEIEVICGAVMREGERIGVPTPANRTLYHLVKSVEDTRNQHIQS